MGAANWSNAGGYRPRLRSGGGGIEPNDNDDWGCFFVIVIGFTLVLAAVFLCIVATYYKKI